MGIMGLMTYCTNSQNGCMNFVDLVKHAEENGGIELLVDFNNFKNTLMCKLARYCCNAFANPFLSIMGTEFSTLDEYLSRLVDLERANIRLVWYIDGGKGTIEEYDISKMERWKVQHDKNRKRIKDTMNICRACDDQIKCSEDDLLFPLVFALQMRSTLKRLNCEIVHFFTGGADYVLARALKERHNGKTYAILSNDSDFCLFDECHLLPYSQMNDEDVKWEDASFLTDRPPMEKCHASVIYSAKLIQQLGFRSHDQLIDLSIVRGNDFTKSFINARFYNEINLKRQKKYPTFDEVVAWVRHWGGLEKSPAMKQYMGNPQNQHWRNAVEQSRKFYRLELHRDPPELSMEDEEFIKARVDDGRFPSDFLTIFNQHYWYMIQCEWPAGCPFGEIVLKPLRMMIYRIILPPFGRTTVTEHIRLPDNDLAIEQVDAFSDDDNTLPLPFLQDVNEEDVDANLKLFHSMISHLETTESPYDFIDHLGRKEGFIFTILRYFLLLNWEKNLYLSSKEFLALVAVTMSDKDVPEYQRLAIAPLPRTVTIANWFLLLYRYAYLYLGSLLYLRDEFPEPRELFSGSTWIVFHSAVYQPGKERAATVVGASFLTEIQKKIEKVIAERREPIEKLIEGCFEFVSDLS